MRAFSACLCALLLAVLFCTGCGPSERRPQAQPLRIGDPAPDLSAAQWVKGEPVTFEKGKIYLVEFWATWCAPCRISIPHLTELQDKHAKDGLVVVGISQEDRATVEPFIQQMGEDMDYNIAIDPERAVYDRYMRAASAEGYPWAFLINRNGVVAWHGPAVAGVDEALGRILK